MKIITFLFLTVSSTCMSQPQDKAALKTIEGTVNKMLEIISGEINEPRNWDEYRNLFLPSSQKIIVNPNAKNPSNKTRVMNIEEFIRYIGPLYSKDGFEEIQIGITINEFNGIANVFQAYHAKNLIGTYDKKGINNYLLVYFDERWWIASMTWSNETEKLKIPSNYLN